MKIINKSTKFYLLMDIRYYLKKEPILCNHCKRTASNGVRCLGMCVADNDY